MMTIVGIDFTEHAVQNLLRRGFRSEAPQSFDSHRKFLFPLNSRETRFLGFEIHVIDDERVYLRDTKMRHFYPYIHEAGVSVCHIAQENGAQTLTKVLSYSDLGTTSLRSYLELRKGFDIPAVLLECQDLETFERIAKPDMKFEINSKPAALIHLGPSCFDLVIMESPTLLS